jgi:hypothetical protein
METSPGFKDYLPIRAPHSTTSRLLIMSKASISDAQEESITTEWNQVLNPRKSRISRHEVSRENEKD